MNTINPPFGMSATVLEGGVLLAAIALTLVAIALAAVRLGGWLRARRPAPATIDWSSDWNYVGPRPDQIADLAAEEARAELRESLLVRDELRREVEALRAELERKERARRRHLSTARRLRNALDALGGGGALVPA